MKIVDGFRDLCRGLHQDALSLAGGSTERMAADCVGFVRREHVQELQQVLSDALSAETAAELKGHINRQKPDLRLSSADARRFLEYVAQRLG